MSASASLYESEPDRPKQKRVDMAMELMVLRCGIGCIVNNIAMDDNDYVRLYLAMSRLGKLQ